MKNTGVENVGLENMGPNGRGGKGRTTDYGSRNIMLHRVGQKKLHTVFIAITLSTLSQFS